MIRALKVVVFLAIAIAGTVANIEVWSMWRPHSYHGHVWVTRETRHWSRMHRELFGPCENKNLPQTFAGK